MRDREKESLVNENGYSEKEQALDTEARSGDLHALKRSKGFSQMSSASKTLAAYQTVSRQLSKLVEEYAKYIEKDLRRAQKMLDEIVKIRAMQKVLLTKLFGNLPEEIKDSEVLKDLREFI